MWLPVSIVSDCLACVCIVYQIVSDCLAWWTIKLATIAFLQQLIYNLHRSTLFASDFQRNLSAGRWLVGESRRSTLGKFLRRSSIQIKRFSDCLLFETVLNSQKWFLFDTSGRISESGPVPYGFLFILRTLNYGWIGWYMLVQDGV